VNVCVSFTTTLPLMMMVELVDPLNCVVLVGVSVPVPGQPVALAIELALLAPPAIAD
jgi:hypothetical protein